MDASVDRIAVPVTADRHPAATTRVAAGLARQAGLGVEFVDAGQGAQSERRVTELRRRCRVTTDAGVDAVSWHCSTGRRTTSAPT